MTFRGENCDNLKGKSGEVGCFQILPSTWKLWAREILGYVPEQVYENQRFVVAGILQKWIDSGMSERQMLWKYNSGRHDICIKGVNKYNAKYDSCQYANVILSINN